MQLTGCCVTDLKSAMLILWEAQHAVNDMCQIHSTVECLAHISFRALNAATFLKVSGLQHLLYKATMKRIFENVAMSHTYHSWRWMTLTHIARKACHMCQQWNLWSIWIYLQVPAVKVAISIFQSMYRCQQKNSKTYHNEFATFIPRLSSRYVYVPVCVYVCACVSACLCVNVPVEMWCDYSDKKTVFVRRFFIRASEEDTLISWHLSYFMTSVLLGWFWSGCQQSWLCTVGGC